MKHAIRRSENERLARSSAVVGVGTLLSRVTGLVRTIALAYALGTTLLSDSYNLANTTPNIVYDLILGGILSATLVPVFVSRFQEDDDDGINAVVTVVSAALVAITVTAILAAPLLFHIYTWASPKAGAAAAAEAGVPLLRLFLPQILFYGLTALATAILNAKRKFAAPAFVPVLNNLLVTIVLIWFARIVGPKPDAAAIAHDPALLWLLGFGTTAGVILMTVALLPSLRSSGWRWRWRWRPRDPAVRRVAELSGWTLGYVIANQVALTIVLALTFKENASAAYLIAFQFFQLPYGLFTVSVMTTFTPELASAAVVDDMERFRSRFTTGARLIAMWILPASVGYVLLAEPTVSALLEHGAFGAASTKLTSDLLANFAIGLIGFSLYLFTLRGFYAMQDTRTPFFLNLFENGLNVVLALVLVGPYGPQGVAFSYSAAYIAAAVLALATLRRRVGRLGGRSLVDASTRILISVVVMTGAVWLVTRNVGSNSGKGAVVQLVVAVAVGAVVYGLTAIALGVEELDGLRRRLHR
jgi:putative peptidoglycan lipid II flippase